MLLTFALYCPRLTGQNNVDDARSSKKRSKKQKEVVVKAEEVDNYKGNQSIDDIISFIGGQDAAKKKTKKLTAATSEDIPSKTQKSNKKNKDKKQKPLLSGSLSVDDGAEVKGGNSAQLVTSDPGGSDNNMGNSSGKQTSVENPVENGDIDALCMNTEKFDLLKENDKLIKNKKRNSSESNEDSDENVISLKNRIHKETDQIDASDKHIVVTEACVVSENNKKKFEKPVKTLKVEKSEMPVSKSEDTMKVDTSVANNITVKQKNAKNKKSKPASPTVKVESESLMGDYIGAPVYSGLPNTDNNFIFTDLEVPRVPKEDEFTIVSKKKKKLLKESHPPQNNFVSSGNGGGNGGKSRKYEDKRSSGGNNISHSFSKATSAQVVSHPAMPVESETHMRDLSPSSFPALGKHEGRRNSTGDVPIPSGLKSQDDSDLESVKSLPATQGSQKIDAALSPRLSYARMAAHLVSNKPVDAGDSLSFGIDDDELDPMKAVWKGSPTERRHSIGSSPEVVNKNTGSNMSSAAATIKAGSQEHIVTDVALKADYSGANIKKNNPWGNVASNETGPKSDMDNVLQKDSSPSEILAVETKVLATMPIHSVPVSKESGSVSQSQLISAPKATTTNKPVESVHTNTEAKNSSSSTSKNHSVSHSSVHKQESMKPNKPSNNTNGKRQKSVIFLDKRVEEAPGNLGISFGFEMDSFDKPEATADPTPATQSDHAVNTDVSSDPNPVHSADTSFVCESYLEPKDVVDIDKSSPSHKSSSSSVISNYVKASKDTKSNVIADTNNSDPINKAQLVRMNGITSSQGQSVNLKSDKLDLVKDAVVSNQSKGFTLDFMSPELPSVELTKDAFGGEVVYYGEYVEAVNKDIVIPSVNNGPIRYCGRVGYMEREDTRSGFNFMDAVGFLTRG